MSVTDPADARLLAALAEMGKAAVHEVAARIGMDPKEAAYRLVGLSASGMPLLVGVESDPNGLRAALSDPNARAGQQAGRPPGPQAPTQAPAQAPQPQPFPPPPAQPAPAPQQGTPSGPYPVQGAPSGPYTTPGAQSGPYPSPPHGAANAPTGAGAPAAPYPAPPQPPQWQQPPTQRAQPAEQGQRPGQANSVISTWGPPQTAMWARGDQGLTGNSATAASSAGTRSGRIGDVLESSGLEGESLGIQLLEVQDPADFLFGAAGYQLAENERAVVVHTEFTNRGRIPFVSLPDNYLELVTPQGSGIAKDPMSLTSRPPHKIGVQPGETAGGHTVYVLPADTRIASVRWSPRPETDERTCTWSIEDQ